MGCQPLGMGDYKMDYRDTVLWKNVSEDQWNDWRWQFKNRIQDVKSLKQLTKLSAGQEKFLGECLNHFRMAITP